MITPREGAHPEHHFRQVNAEDRFADIQGRPQAMEISRTELSRARSVIAFAKALFKAFGYKELSKKAALGAKVTGSVIASRAIISGEARNGLEQDCFSEKSHEREKFWASLSGYVTIINIPIQVMSRVDFLNTAMNLEGVSETLDTFGDVVKREKTEARSKSAMAAVISLTDETPTRERVIRYTTLVKESTAVMHIATAAMGYPHISLGLAFLSKTVGLVKVFIKPADFVPYQSQWTKELIDIKNTAIFLVEDQFEEGIAALKQRKDLKKEHKEQMIAGLEISLRSNKKAIIEAPDEAVLYRSLLYFELENHGLFEKQIFAKLKSDEILALENRCMNLSEQQQDTVDEKVEGLLNQKAHIKILQDRLKDGLDDLKNKYKEGHVIREFMTQEINYANGELKEELDKIDAMLEEKTQKIDHRALPMFEAHELTEDLSERFDVNQWIFRADTLQNQKHTSNLNQRVETALSKPAMHDILNI